MKGHVLQRALVGLVVWTLAGCGKRSDPVTTGPGGPGGEVETSSEAVADAVAGTLGAGLDGSKSTPTLAPPTPTTKSGDDGPLTLGGRLEAEANARTRVKPEVEDVLAAFASAGLAVAEVRQGVARTSRAQYCVFGTSPGGHRVFVCEFADVDGAEQGAAFMASQLVDPRRRVEAHGRLALTVFLTVQTPEADRERQQYFDIFARTVAPVP